VEGLLRATGSRDGFCRTGHRRAGPAVDLLTIILGYADLLQEPGRADDRSRYAAEQISLAGRKAADLTQKLLALSRRQLLQVSVFNLDEVLRGIEGLLRRLLPENIRITIHLDPAVQPIRADRTALERAIPNLAANARDAMPAGGDFGLITSHRVLSSEDRDTLTDLQPGTYLQLRVSDMGCGMDESTRNHVFEPLIIGNDAPISIAIIRGWAGPDTAAFLRGSVRAEPVVGRPRGDRPRSRKRGSRRGGPGQKCCPPPREWMWD